MVKHVAILIYEGCWASSVFSALDLFRIVSLLEKHLGLACHYRVRLVSLTGDSVQSSSGHCLIPDASLNDEADYDLLVIPPMEGARLGVSSVSFQADPTILIALQRTHAHGGRLLAMTTGVFFIAAAAGIPQEVPMATHWAYVRALRSRFPQHTFIANQPFLQSERIWTTGTLNGSFDALLEIVALDCGDTFSQLCAAHLLVEDPERQPSILPGTRSHADLEILRVQEWIDKHYAEAVTLDQMSLIASVSERTLKRRFQRALRTSPNVYLQKVRIDKAKKRLLTTERSVKTIAYEVGYENVSFFVRLFTRFAGQTPAQWRKAVKAEGY